MSDDDICPLCGREFDHKRKTYKNSDNPTFADDVSVCSRSTRGSANRAHFIHYL